MVVNSVPKEVLPSYIKLVRDAVSSARDKERRKKKVSAYCFSTQTMVIRWECCVDKKTVTFLFLFNPLAGRPRCYSRILSSKSSSTIASDISSGVPAFHLSPKCVVCHYHLKLIFENVGVY